MLSVSFSLALVAAMLFGIVLPGHHKEVDKFNGQTRGPIPAGNHYLVSILLLFKPACEYLLKRWKAYQRWAVSDLLCAKL